MTYCNKSVIPNIIYITVFILIEMERPGKKNQREDDNEVTVSTILRYIHSFRTKQCNFMGIWEVKDHFRNLIVLLLEVF